MCSCEVVCWDVIAISTSQPSSRREGMEEGMGMGRIGQVRSSDTIFGYRFGLICLPVSLWIDGFVSERKCKMPQREKKNPPSLVANTVINNTIVGTSRLSDYYYYNNYTKLWKGCDNPSKVLPEAEAAGPFLPLPPPLLPPLLLTASASASASRTGARP